MAEKPDREKSPAKDRDERVAIPLDPEEALRGLLEVDPNAEPPAPARSKDIELSDEELRMH